MNFKENVNTIKTLRCILANLEAELEEIRDRAFGQGSPSIDKLDVMTSLPADPMAEAVIEYSDLLVEYHGVKNEYNRRRLYAMRTIRKYIDDPKVISILALRYIHGKSYGEIGRQYSLDYRKVQSIVRWNTREIERKIKSPQGS